MAIYLHTVPKRLLPGPGPRHPAYPREVSKGLLRYVPLSLAAALAALLYEQTAIAFIQQPSFQFVYLVVFPTLAIAVGSTTYRLAGGNLFRACLAGSLALLFSRCTPPWSLGLRGQSCNWSSKRPAARAIGWVHWRMLACPSALSADNTAVDAGDRLLTGRASECFEPVREQCVEQQRRAKPHPGYQELRPRRRFQNPQSTTPRRPSHRGIAPHRLPTVHSSERESQPSPGRLPPLAIRGVVTATRAPRLARSEARTPNPFSVHALRRASHLVSRRDPGSTRTLLAISFNYHVEP